MTAARSLLLFLLATFALGVVAPGADAADDPRAKRDAIREKRVALANEVDALQSTNRELEAAVKVLDEAVAANAAAVESARQAVEAAESELADERAVLATHQARLDEVRSHLVDRAIESFINPEATGLDEMMDSTDITEAARKQALLDRVAASDADLIDQYRTVRVDYKETMAAAETAEQKARERRDEVERELAELEKARADQARAKEELEKRKSGLLAEIEAHYKEEVALNVILGDASPMGPDGVSAGGCAWPADGPVTSEYGARWGRTHAGIDIGAPTGAPIRAAKTGTVIFAGVQGGYGNTVVVDHGGGLTTLYAHQSRTAVTKNATVAQGQVIGYVGSTGQSTGPHLHFETRHGGAPRNPRTCL